MSVCRHAFAITLVIVTLSTPVLANDLSKEACLDAYSRGQDAREQGKLSLARKLFLSCAQSTCPALVQGDCARFADDLGRQQPTLNLVARDGTGADLPDTTVYIDGVLTVTRLDDGKPHDVDPGPHTIKFIHGTRDQTMTIVVGAGEKGRTIAAAFAEPVAASTGSTARGKSKRSPAATTTHPTGAKLMIGIGAVMVVGGGSLGGIGLLRVPDNCSFATHQCAAPPGDPSFADASSAIHTSNIGWIIGAVGVATVAGGVVWYLGGKRTAKAAEVVAAPWITSEAAGFAVMGHL